MPEKNLTRDETAALLEEAQRNGHAALCRFPDRQSADWQKLAAALDSIQGITDRLRIEPLPDRILAVMNTHDGRSDYTASDIALRLDGVSRAQVSHHLGRLRTEGKVRRTQGLRNGYACPVYGLPR